MRKVNVVARKHTLDGTTLPRRLVLLANALAKCAIVTDDGALETDIVAQQVLDKRRTYHGKFALETVVACHNGRRAAGLDHRLVGKNDLLVDVAPRPRMAAANNAISKEVLGASRRRDARALV